jgi:hypothetical protein
MEKKIVFTTVEPNKNLLWLHYKNDQLVLQRFGSNGWEDISNSDQSWSQEIKDLQENTVRTDISQDFSNAQQDVALSNIGLDFVHIDYSLLGTTLTDEMFAVLDNAKGIILVNTPSSYINARVFIKGNNTSGSCIFVNFVTGNTYSIFTLNKSTKLLSVISSGLTYGGSVRYAESQNLTDVQKQQARSNIGVQSAGELLEDADFIAQLKTKLETV